MSCTDLTGFNCRVSNKPGVSKIHIFLFDAISQYVYTADDLNFVSGYSATQLPTTYKPSSEGSSYAGSKKDGNIDLFLHQLTLSFSKMEKEKRAEFEKLRNLELTIIFEDANGLSWIIGQHHPCKLEEFSLQSGAKGGANDYTAVFQSIEPYEIREIEGVSEGCFTSFSGSEQRRSVLTITGADALDMLDFRLAADDRIIDFTASPALQPSLWSGSPAIFANDTAQLLTMFEAGGTILSFAPSYSAGGGGTVTIVVDSNDTSFGGLIVDDIIQAPSTIGIVLRLQTILSPEIANVGTIIEVSDSDGVLFSGGYGTAIVGSGLAGTTNDAYIFVSFLYATTTTFTATIVDLPCSTVSYEYVFENTLTPCELTIGFDFFKGTLLKTNVPYVIYENVDMTGEVCPKFQNLHVNIMGYIFNMYETRDLWHDNIIQFRNDFINLVASIASPIDPSSLFFGDTGTSIDIYFRLPDVDFESTNTSIYCNSTQRGFEQLVTDRTQFRQSRVLNLNTYAPYGSIITHVDDFANEISGTNLVDIIGNDAFILENAPPTANETIDNLGILWAFEDTTIYNEESEITTTAQSDTCLTPTVVSQFSKCYEGFTSDTEYNYYTAKLDVSTGSVNIGKNILFDITTPLVLSLARVSPVDLTPTSGSHFMSAIFNSVKGIKLLHYDFNPSTFEYVFHLRVVASTALDAITDVDNARAFVIALEDTIFTNGLTAKIAPHCTLDWTLPTTETSVPTGAKDLTEGEWQEKITNTLFATIDFNFALDKLTVTLADNNQEVNVRIFPTADYPISTIAATISETIALGDTLLEISDVSTLCVPLADFGFIVVTNQFGWAYVLWMDFTANFNEGINESVKAPICWGTMDTIEYIGSLQTEDAPIFSSAICV
jgi:hypothetical protein